MYNHNNLPFRNFITQIGSTIIVFTGGEPWGPGLRENTRLVIKNMFCQTKRRLPFWMGHCKCYSGGQYNTSVCLLAQTVVGQLQKRGKGSGERSIFALIYCGGDGIGDAYQVTTRTCAHIRK